MNRIVDFIEHLECPLVNGIILPDETVQLLDIQVNRKTHTSYHIKKGLKTSVNILSANRSLHYSSCAILANSINQSHSIEVIAGEADHGSDGFVGVLDLESKKSIWVAFFDCSNPFYKVEIIEDRILATSTIGCVWQFKMNDPIDCSVECE